MKNLTNKPVRLHCATGSTTLAQKCSGLTVYNLCCGTQDSAKFVLTRVAFIRYDTALIQQNSILESFSYTVYLALRLNVSCADVIFDYQQEKSETLHI